jgi:hypothetical protein
MILWICMHDFFSLFLGYPIAAINEQPTIVQ